MAATWYNLQVAITARYKGSNGASLRTVLGETSSVPKFFALSAPHGTVLPYVIFRPTVGTMLGSMTDEIKNPMVDFSAYVDEFKLDQGINEIAPKIAALYSDVYMQLTGGHVIMARRDTPILPLPDPDGGYQVVQTFKYMHD